VGPARQHPDDRTVESIGEHRGQPVGCHRARRRAGPADRLADLAHLVALLHQTATGDPALHAALPAVTSAPEDPSRVAALAHAVDALASRNSGLRAELERLLDHGQQHPTAGQR
jgi:hypothetical protein